MSEWKGKIAPRTEGSPRKRDDTIGAWLPWSVVKVLIRLNFRTASEWRILLAVTATSYRYGGRDARLTINDLARSTGLSSRTVKTALSRLISGGLVQRIGRYGKLRVNLQPRDGAGADRYVSGNGAVGPGVSRVAESRDHDDVEWLRRRDEPSPSIICPEEGTFTSKQRALIARVLSESSSRLGDDCARLPMLQADAERLEFPAGTTFGEGFRNIEDSGDHTKAQIFTKAVNKLRWDARIEGEELEFQP